MASMMQPNKANGNNMGINIDTIANSIDQLIRNLVNMFSIITQKGKE